MSTLFVARWHDVTSVFVTGKKRRLEKPSHGPTSGSTATAKHPRVSSGSAKIDHASAPPRADAQHSAPPPSNVLKKLSGLSSRSNAQSESGYVRSSSLSEKPKPIVAKQPEHEASYEASHSAPQRDENLAIIEELRMGPTDHKALLDDPLFERLEPNSGIHLSYVLTMPGTTSHFGMTIPL